MSKIVTCPGRYLVTLKIETQDGVHGVRDSMLSGRELPPRYHVSTLADTCA